MQTELGNQPTDKCEAVLQDQFGYPTRFKSLSCQRHILHQKIYAAESWFVVQDKEDGNFFSTNLMFLPTFEVMHLDDGFASMSAVK
ncbi:hypothetical protein BPOR_0004g00270 [Botrytis porri]|uniref:Uncharacterized protein n=1 Tax=Botrytis porri TaxID=87229 RepID=A0A4Z1L6B9_9HELO|nr:hypothetical protein BPOR_0004g00270 [Botrytis porri]